MSNSHIITPFNLLSHFCEVRMLEPLTGKHHLYKRIETLREQLHQQEDFTKHDALKVSAELDRLILKAMKDKYKNRA